MADEPEDSKKNVVPNSKSKGKSLKRPLEQPNSTLNEKGGVTEAKKPRKNSDFFHKIDTSVGQILHSGPDCEPLDAKNYMELYSSVYSNLVNNSIKPTARTEQVKFVGGCTAEDIYSRLENILKKNLKQLAQEAKGFPADQLLNFYADRFKCYKRQSTLVDGIFSYMNRTWVTSMNVTNTRSQKTIYLFAMLQWRRIIYQEFITQVTESFFSLIGENRRDLSGSQEIIKRMVDAYIAMSDLKDEATLKKYGTLNAVASSTTESEEPSPTLDEYTEKFEGPFIEQSRQFYKELSEEWMKSFDVSGYMKSVEKYLDEETAWAESTLHHTTTPKLSVAILDEFVRHRVQFLLTSFDSLVSADDFDSLKCMYNLLIRVSESSMNSTVPGFRGEMISRGKEAVQSIYNEFTDKKIDVKRYPLRYVNALVAVCAKHDKIIRDCFNNHMEFRKAYDEACVEFINRNCETKGDGDQYNLSRTPEQLSRFANNLLHANNVMGVVNVQEAIKNMFLILKYTESKDSFEKYYNLYLLERLIKKTSASEDLETSVITQMKTVFGADYSLKAFQLTQDAKISQDLSKQFKGYMHEKGSTLPWDFQISIFRNGSCKLPPSPPFNIPQELLSRMSEFSNFYQEQHSGRALNWYHNKSYGELVYNADMNKKYTFVLSTYQMTILLMYNDNKSYTYDEIKDHTQIGDNILNQILPVFEKTKILTRDPSTGAYELFENYRSNKSRMDINIPLRMETKPDSEVVDEDVQSQRQYVLQAIMVRLMKANQRLRHSDLIAQAITEASKRFKPNINSIKRTIESLIEREYFKRDEDEPDLYIYIS